LKLSSTEAGTARITVTGNGFGCEKYMDGFTYIDTFEKYFFPESIYDSQDGLHDGLEEGMSSYSNFGDWWSFCVANVCLGELELPYEYYVDYFYWYWLGVHTQGIEAQMQLNTPICMEWGVIPLTPKSIDVQFMQSFQDQIQLEKGWNFFSVPVDPAVSNDQWSELGLDTICDGGSAYWNEAAQAWVAPVPASEMLTPMEAYWCKTSSATTIPIIPMDKSNVYLPPVKTIFTGWNDVGLSSYVEMKMEHALISIDKIYSTVLDWVESLQKYTSYANTGELGGGNVPGTTGTGDMEAGQGYFIYVQDGGGILAGQS
jgi:hypothetical protein